MNAIDIENHKKLKYYVSVNIPQVREVPAIINALKSFSGNSAEEKIKDALLWNKGPIISIVDKLQCGDVADASGCYTEGVDQLEISAGDVQNFEDGKDLKHTTKGHLVCYIGVTLLHELCPIGPMTARVQDKILLSSGEGQRVVERRASIEAIFPEVGEAAAVMNAAQGDDLIGSGDGPKHPRLFAAGTHDGFAA